MSSEDVCGCRGGVAGKLPPNFNYKPPEKHDSKLPELDKLKLLDLGTYSRDMISNASTGSTGRLFFDIGLRLFHAYQHELSARCFRACLEHNPDCALAYAFVALCHGPNYNFNRDHYYTSSNGCTPGEVVNEDDAFFPSQSVAEKYSRLAVDKVEEIRKRYRQMKGGSEKTRLNDNNTSDNGDLDDSDSSQLSSEPMIRDVEAHIISSVRLLACQPGIDAYLAEEAVGRPYADSMRKVQARYPDDPEVSYLFAESLMVLHAWMLYEFPSGRPLSKDVPEIEGVLETALKSHPNHVGLSHLYVHLCEMSSEPARALRACETLRTKSPDAGHLRHMATHIDALLGDYESVVRFNIDAIRADDNLSKLFPEITCPTSFYFGYIAHDYHMLVYGGILGGMEGIAMTYARHLTEILNEDLFTFNPDIATYLESYSSLDIHILLRFGHWDEILTLALPVNETVMLYRAAMLRSARAVALANKNELLQAKEELALLQKLHQYSEAVQRILHNNSVDRLIEVEIEMIKGEIAYFEGYFEESFNYLRKSVELQDALNFDEPEGKMQPIRHALGALLLKKGHAQEAESTFRSDLQYHPRNPWAMVGLIECLKLRLEASDESHEATLLEYQYYSAQLQQQRESKFADYNVIRSCDCARS